MRTPLYLCRWPNGNCSFVWATTKGEVIELLDESANAEGCPLTGVQDFMVHFRLTDTGQLEFEEFSELAPRRQEAGITASSARGIRRQFAPYTLRIKRTAARESERARRRGEAQTLECQRKRSFPNSSNVVSVRSERGDNKRWRK
jgi:hypothetical protein